MSKCYKPNMYIDWTRGGRLVQGGSTDKIETPTDELIDAGNFSMLQLQYGVLGDVTGTPTLKIYSAMTPDGQWNEMTNGGYGLTARSTGIATLDGATTSHLMYRYIKWEVTDTGSFEAMMTLQILLRR